MTRQHHGIMDKDQIDKYIQRNCLRPASSNAKWYKLFSSLAAIEPGFIGMVMLMNIRDSRVIYLHYLNPMSEIYPSSIEAMGGQYLYSQLLSLMIPAKYDDNSRGSVNTKIQDLPFIYKHIIGNGK